MTSIIKVDTIQTAAGGTPTASSLGISGTGKIGQVVGVSTTTRHTTSSTSFTAVSDMSLSITPTSASSKIYLTAMQTIGIPPSGGYKSRITIFRNGTNINGNDNGMASIFNDTSGNVVTIPMIFLDSPATTSAITYQIYFRSPDGTTISYNNDSGSTSTFQAMEVLA